MEWSLFHGLLFWPAVVTWTGTKWGIRDQCLTQWLPSAGPLCVPTLFSRQCGHKNRGRSPKTFSIGFSAGLSPILVKISVNCLNWWELRWRNCHQIWWHFGWRFCHLLFHPIWWFFWRTAWNGENWGDENVTKFGDNSCDDFVTFYVTHYGDFWGDLPELVIIKVMVWSPYLVKIHVTILSLFVSPHRVIFLGICRNRW